MVPKQLDAFGGGAAETMLHPMVLVWMLITVVLILTLPRKRVVVPLIFSFFMIPLAQVVVVGGLHFPVLRILILAGLVRMIVSRKEKFPGGFNSLDQVIVLWTISAWLIINLRWLDPGMVVKSTGDFLDALGGYLAVRFLIPDVEALRRAVKVFAVVCLIQGLLMVSEQFTHQNAFGFLGAHPPELREGHIRSEGVLGTLYGGPIAASLVPVFIWLWTNKNRMSASIGLIGATTMVFASHASTSWMTYAAGILGLTFWPLRKQMRLVRLGIVAMLVGLHLVMKGPVWSLIEKIDLTGGSSNFHRYWLVDMTIRHFTDWWLVGTTDYGNWGWESWDLANQFVVAALTGGLVTFVLYVLVFKRAFAIVGTARKQVEGNRGQEWFLWCLGACLFANVVASFGINYMIQLQFFLSSMLACVSVACHEATMATVSEMQQTPKLIFGVHPVGGRI
jgi:hypothetical protein